MVLLVYFNISHSQSQQDACEESAVASVRRFGGGCRAVRLFVYWRAIWLFLSGFRTWRGSRRGRMTCNLKRKRGGGRKGKAGTLPGPTRADPSAVQTLSTQLICSGSLL